MSSVYDENFNYKTSSACSNSQLSLKWYLLGSFTQLNQPVFSGVRMRNPEKRAGSRDYTTPQLQRHGESGDGVASVYLPVLLLGLWQL